MAREAICRLGDSWRILLTWGPLRNTQVGLNISILPPIIIFLLIFKVLAKLFIRVVCCLFHNVLLPDVLAAFFPGHGSLASADP